MPFEKILIWLEKEKELGSVNPDRVVLATASSTGIPHSRIVAIREISHNGVLFFNQDQTRKVIGFEKNPHASMTLWLAQQQRQVVLDGHVIKLTEEENYKYWQTMTRERQLRFYTYALTSGQSLQSSMSALEKRYQELTKQFESVSIPMSPFYVGFRFAPEIIYFYTLGTDTFSEVEKYTKLNEAWIQEQISP